MTRDSGSDRQAETAKQAPGEASQNGDSVAGASPKLDRDSLLSESRHPSIDELVERLKKRVHDHRFSIDSTGTWSVPIRSSELEALLTALTRPLGEGEELRSAVCNAIFDPGRHVGMKGERSLTTWQTDAVMSILARSTPPQTEETRLREALNEVLSLFDAEGALFCSGEWQLEVIARARKTLSTSSSLLLTADRVLAPDGLRLLADLHDALTLAAEYAPSKTVTDFVTASDQFHAARAALLSAAPQPPSPGQGEREGMRQILEEQAQRPGLDGKRGPPPSSGEAEAVARAICRARLARTYNGSDQDGLTGQVSAYWQADLDLAEAAIAAFSPKADGGNHD